MNRRTVLRRAVPISAALTAGCAAPRSEPDGRNESGDRENGGDSNDVTGTAPIPMLEDPPEAVYLPGHRKSMRALEPVEAGDYLLAPMLSYPHPFWVVTGTDRRLVEPESGRGVHLMIVVWDRETETVLPGTAEPTVTITKGDEQVTSRPLWPMLSQEMGLHFGDNVSLPADGTYTASVELPPLPTRRTGSLDGRFTDGGTAAFEFTYDEAFRDAVVDGIELLDRERWGERGALEPMTGGSDGGMDEMGADIPYSALPPADDYPGTRLVDPTADADASADGLPRSGDAAFVVTLLESGSRLADGDGRYLLVSPRTPYNRVPLTNTSLRAVIERDGEPVGDGPVELVQTLDGELGLHYGRSLADIRSGDSVRIEIESPPQTARHQGYETAFFEMDALELSVPD
ncbi:DUF7350 domain-containing protein [Natrinema sp. LN54]|uniref:DUF7350 domain-containing protein n=1 Tax=Natrinema sp. LN54 TaxID=3458705 RepID=UPI00403623F0